MTIVRKVTPIDDVADLRIKTLVSIDQQPNAQRGIFSWPTGGNWMAVDSSKRSRGGAERRRGSQRPTRLRVKKGRFVPHFLKHRILATEKHFLLPPKENLLLGEECRALAEAFFPLPKVKMLWRSRAALGRKHFLLIERRKCSRGAFFCSLGSIFSSLGSIFSFAGRRFSFVVRRCRPSNTALLLFLKV
jgi:hypothetical protein